MFLIHKCAAIPSEVWPIFRPNAVEGLSSIHSSTHFKEVLAVSQGHFIGEWLDEGNKLQFSEFVIKKLLTRPIWWWERRRSYPVRSQFDRLPPVAVKKAEKRFVVLTTSAAFEDALWSAWSWYRYLHRGQFELRIVIDGEIAQAEESAARRLFPGVQFDRAATIVADLGRSQPALESFLQQHPLGKKLGLLLALSQQSSFLYCDHDVQAFNSPDEILELIEKGTPFYLEEEYRSHLDAVIVERAESLGLGYISRLNSGLLYVPKGAISVDLAVQLLAGWRPPMTSWYTEQAVISILMCQARASPLPGNRYVVSNRRQFYWEKDVDYSAIAARHFTGTVRHVMYGKGMPELLRQARCLLEGAGK